MPLRALGCCCKAPCLAPACTPGRLLPTTVSKSLLLVNGTDGIAGVEYGQDLVYHNHSWWKMYLFYVSALTRLHCTAT